MDSATGYVHLQFDGPKLIILLLKQVIQKKKQKKTKHIMCISMFPHTPILYSENSGIMYGSILLVVEGGVGGSDFGILQFLNQLFVVVFVYRNLFIILHKPVLMCLASKLFLIYHG